MGKPKDKPKKSSTISSVDQPWIDNYPPLRDFLREIDAHCDWQVKNGTGPYADMVEQWRAPGTAPFIIVVRSHQHGWDIFTSEIGNKIDAAIEDAKKRIYYPKLPGSENS